MNKPLISVVIPTYNHHHFIKNALDSVVKQTYNNWEIIVVDNHSTDNTNDILNSFRQYNLKVISVHNNGVIAVSRNVGIKAAKGEWIAFLDSDDGWSEDKLQNCVSEMTDDTDIIFHDLIIQTLNPSLFKKRKIKGKKLSKPILEDLLCNGNKISNSSVVIRKKVLKEVGYISTDKEMVAGEDFNTWLKLASLNYNFKYIPLCLGYYTIHDTGMSRKDMSIPMYNSTAEFVHNLSKPKQKQLLAHIKYTHCRYMFCNKSEISIQADLYYCIRNGSIEIMIKSLYMLFVNFLLFTKRVLINLFHSDIQY